MIIHLLVSVRVWVRVWFRVSVREWVKVRGIKSRTPTGHCKRVWSLNSGLNKRKTSSYEFGMMLAKSLFMLMSITRPLVGLSSKIRSLCHTVTRMNVFWVPHQTSKPNKIHLAVLSVEVIHDANSA